MAPAERFGPADEKVTINVGPVDLGEMDLLVSEGLYATRTDFVREAIRRQLDRHEAIVQDVVARKEFVVGFTFYSRKDFERLRDAGKRIRLRVIGACKLSSDIEPDLAATVIESVSVLGTLSASKEVKAKLRALAEAR
jgi:Arc/MetJ-type ribon-helix-helix transcriptional regulator